MNSADVHEPAAPLNIPRVGSPRILIGLIVLLGATLRLIALDRVPPAICQDEAVNGYDAWCILKTGTDHYGTPWPIFFRSFGDYHPGLPVYLQIPFQMILGMNVWSTRLPDALFGIAHIFFAYLLVRLFYGKRTALWAAGLLAVSPWHIHLSRLAFGIATSVSLVALGLMLISKRLYNGRGRIGPIAVMELFVAGLALGATLWTYHAMRMVVPLLLGAGAMFSLPRLRSLVRMPGGRLAISLLAGGFLIGLSPFLWTWVRTSDQVWARAASLSILGQSASAVEATKLVLHNYAAHFTPSFLFLEGDFSLVQSIPGYGQLHHAFLLFLPLGLYRVVRNWRSEPFGRFVLWWIVIAPIPASFARLDFASGHCLRAAGVLPAYDILAAMGIDTLIRAAACRHRRAASIVMAATLASIVAGTAFFAYQFFRYPVEAAKFFSAEWRAVIEEIERRRFDYDAVVLTDLTGGHVGIQYLFWSRMDPVAYHRARPIIISGPEADGLIQIGTTFFANAKFLEEIVAVLRPGARLLVAEVPGMPVPGQPLLEFPDGKGSPAIILYDVRTTGHQRGTPQSSEQGR